MRRPRRRSRAWMHLAMQVLFAAAIPAVATNAAAIYAANPPLQTRFRRAEFWQDESCTLLDVCNVLGRWESSSEWSERTVFTEVTDFAANTVEHAATLERYERANKMGVVQRVAFRQNIASLPFRNEQLAASVGLTKDDFNALELNDDAISIVFDVLAESKSGLVAPEDVDARRAALLDTESGGLDETAFRVALYKARLLVIASWFVWGKGNIVALSILLKVIYDTTGLSFEVFNRFSVDQVLLVLSTASLMATVGSEQDKEMYAQLAARADAQKAAAAAAAAEAEAPLVAAEPERSQ